MTSFRRLAAVALLAMPVALLAACGSGPSEQVVRTDDPANAVMAAAERSLAAGTQHMSMTSTIDGEVVMAFEGVATLDGTTFDGSMTMPGIGDVNYRIVDGSFYFGFPGLPDGVSWVGMGHEDLAMMGMDVEAMSEQQAGGNQALELLAAEGAKVERVGSEDLDGVPTTRYRAVIDTRSAVFERSGLPEELVERTAGMFGDTMVIELWIDADGYARRIEQVIDLSEIADRTAGLPEHGEMRYVFEMRDFGEPISVEAPPEAEVISMTEFFGRMAGGEFNPVGEAIASN